MKDVIIDEFQNAVSDSLLRHKSILDIMTKLQESEARLNRAVIKSVTSCGCIEINAKKKSVPENVTIEEYTNYRDTHINGELCESCRDVIEKELGNNLFYMVSICNALGINLYDTFVKEYNKIKVLGKYDMR